MGVSWLFQVYLKEVAKVFQEGFKRVEKLALKVCKASFKFVQGCFKGMSVGPKVRLGNIGCLKIFLKVLQKSLKTGS